MKFFSSIRAQYFVTAEGDLISLCLLFIFIKKKLVIKKAEKIVGNTMWCTKGVGRWSVSVNSPQLIPEDTPHVSWTRALKLWKN